MVTGSGHAERKRQFLVHIDPDLKRRVKVLAAERGVTASSIVQEAIRQYLAAEGPTGEDGPVAAGAIRPDPT